MEDLIKALVNAPASGVLVLAGLAFLAVGVFGRLTERLDPGPRGRLVSGGLGAILLVVGLVMSGGPRPAPVATAPKPAPAPPVAAATPAPSPSAAPQPTPAPAASSPAAQPAPAPPAPAKVASAYPVTFPGDQVVKRDEVVYWILKMQFDEYDAKQLGLDITVRMNNQTAYPANFWDRSFRLLVDGVPRAPVGGLNELVDGHAAKEGVVKFVVPKDAATVALQIELFDPSAATVPIPLPPR